MSLAQQKKRQPLNGYEHLTVDPNYMGGRPAVIGRRITVEQILEGIAQGLTADDYERHYHVPREAVFEAVKLAGEIASGRYRLAVAD